MTWNDVIGQQKVKQRLIELAGSERMPHALMLAGNTGYGSLALALAMASRLLCQSPLENGEPCGECPQCAMLRQWHHPDLHFSYPTVNTSKTPSGRAPISDDFSKEWNEMICSEGAYISLDKWMKYIKETTKQFVITAAESDSISKKLSLKSSQGGYKVCIIWMAELMNEESANKILKTLEEPAPQTVFILVVEQPERLLETIRSRVQRIDVPKIAAEDLTAALVAQRGVDETVARALARACDGNYIRAVEQLMPDAEVHIFLKLFQNLMRAVWAKDVRQMKDWSNTVGDKSFGREKQKRLLIYFMRLVRESFMSNFQEPELSYMTADEQQFISKFGRFINEANVIEINELLETALRDISQNVNQKLVLFDTALRMTVLLLRK